MTTAELIKIFKTTIKSSLKRTDVANITDELEAAYDHEKVFDADIKKAFVDQSFRNYLTEDLLSVPEEANLDICKAVIDLSIEAVRKDLCSSTVPVSLLSDVFDCITLLRCESLFSYVESNISVWKEAIFFQSIKNNLLRVCNDLLRRLSRSQNTVFCGRILVFLAKFFPFSERSGLNVISEFNTENLTVFNSDDQFDLIDENGSNGHHMDVDDEESPAAKKIKIEEDQKSLLIDYALYSKFWELQDFFRNPVQCYEEESWKKFSTYSDVVLKTFQSFKIESVSLRNDGLMLKSDHKEEEKFFAKYLTNQNLLQLQLSDSNFRRYIYVQMLILFQYLQSSVKFKHESQALDDEQSKWINSTRQKIFNLLKETPPNGEKFFSSVEHLLKREEQWNKWKNEGCQSLVVNINKAKTETQNGDGGVVLGTRKRKRRLGDLINDSEKSGRFLMGNAALTKLWNICPDNLEACASADRDFLPSVEEYFGEAVDQLDPDNQVEEAYKKVNDGAWGWRALRLLARKTPHFFTYSNNPIAKLPDYLDNMLKRMAASGAISTRPKKETNADSQEDEAKTEAKSEPEEPETSSFVCSHDQLEKLAENLALQEKWESLPGKLGVDDETLKKLYKEKKATETKDMILVMLEKWSEQEGQGATNEEIIYILEGLKMGEAVKDVFPETKE